ncbi:hypothetical protein MANES_12G062000v8 [Manihot esculenta]|uniref:Uncharacterized protein n=1 Tax=Manihot esculenta TaxID=3983 RepID=A0A2C9UU53_MANES|nr:hypothetical protein MANES_12G062000v8 [Manihot esculenta]
MRPQDSSPSFFFLFSFFFLISIYFVQPLLTPTPFSLSLYHTKIRPSVPHPKLPIPIIISSSSIFSSSSWQIESPPAITQPSKLTIYEFSNGAKSSVIYSSQDSV